MRKEKGCASTWSIRFVSLHCEFYANCEWSKWSLNHSVKHKEMYFGWNFWHICAQNAYIRRHLWLDCNRKPCAVLIAVDRRPLFTTSNHRDYYWLGPIDKNEYCELHSNCRQRAFSSRKSFPHSPYSIYKWIENIDKTKNVGIINRIHLFPNAVL